MRCDMTKSIFHGVSTSWTKKLISEEPFHFALREHSLALVITLVNLLHLRPQGVAAPGPSTGLATYFGSSTDAI